MRRFLVKTLCGPLSLTLMISCNNASEKTSAFQYPETRKVDTIDSYFGVEVKDPYRWLEDDLSPETAEWVKAQNDLTFSYLDKIPYRDKIMDRLEKLYSYERLGARPPKKVNITISLRTTVSRTTTYYTGKRNLTARPRYFSIPTRFQKMEPRG